MSDIIARLTAALAEHYRIEREIGVGGMATVYLAHDLKHQRDVAIKVLHPDLGASLGGERFLAEIRTTARLQHPHILPLLDSGDASGLLYYVMPLVTGETLRARLDRENQLPLDDAVLIAREVADALGYAHGLGVIHRDIKPENILLQNGHALVADFGIAIAVQQAGGQRMTQTGLSLGTPQYMSPEQAMGERVVDARSDLYALAAVTYEMLIGEAPFTGPTVQAIVARVMTEEPRSLVAQRRAIPDTVEYAVLRALEKLPADRFDNAKGFIDALHGAVVGSTAEAVLGARYAGSARTMGAASGGWRARLRDPVVLALGVIAVAGVISSLWLRRASLSVSEGEVVRFSIPAPQSGIARVLGLSTLSISLDGRMLVFVGQSEGRRQQLMVRPIDAVEAMPIPGTDDADNPVFSPDGKWVAFIRGNQLFRVALSGGAPQLLGDAPGTFNGMSWSTTGVIVLSGNFALYKLAESGGEAKEFTRADRTKGELYQDGPIVIDEEKVVLYASWHGTGIPSSKIAIASLETGQTTVLDIAGVQPLGIIDGVLVYVVANGNVMGVRIDAAKRKVFGATVQLGNDVFLNSTSGLARAALSGTGTLFYQRGTQLSQVVFKSDRDSARVILGDLKEHGFPRLSPDGKQLAITIGASGRRDIWVYELKSLAPTRLTTEGSTNERPEWSPDGKRVLFRSDRGDRSAIWWRPADLSAQDTPLLADKLLDVFEAVLSPDSRFIAYQVDTAGADLYYRELNGDATPVVIANSRGVETMPRISPDGNWIAFVTDESGRNEVVVQPLPGPGARTQVSTGGGSEPVWTRDGKRLVYRADGQFMAATVQGGLVFKVTSRDVLFVDDFAYSSNPHANYDVAPDGRSFFLVRSVGEGDMIVVSNWRRFLRERMAGSTSN